MPMYFIKPVAWNSNGYRKPSGAKFTSGYPKDHGYGHEEWNNSNRLGFTQGRVGYRAFHTEELGNQDLRAHKDDVFVFMIASFKGRQYLVGMAGNATYLRHEDDKPLRVELARRLNLLPLERDAWELLQVRNCYTKLGGRAGFIRNWTKDIAWIPNWTCREEHFVWLADPLALNAKAISGKDNLIRMFGSYQTITNDVAVAILRAIPPTEPGYNRVQALLKICETPDTDVAADIAAVMENKKIKKTERDALIKARIGQGQFRADLERVWNNACAVTQACNAKVLRASHIVAWRCSTNRERLDENNGLLLTANLDALFDAHLISFNEEGKLVVADALSDDDKRRLGIHRGMKLKQKPNGKQWSYLRKHNKEMRKKHGEPS